MNGSVENGVSSIRREREEREGERGERRERGEREKREREERERERDLAKHVFRSGRCWIFDKRNGGGAPKTNCGSSNRNINIGGACCGIGNDSNYDEDSISINVSTEEVILQKSSKRSFSGLCDVCVREIQQRSLGISPSHISTF